MKTVPLRAALMNHEGYSPLSEGNGGLPLMSTFVRRPTTNTRSLTWWACMAASIARSDSMRSSKKMISALMYPTKVEGKFSSTCLNIGFKNGVPKVMINLIVCLGEGGREEGYHEGWQGILLRQKSCTAQRVPAIRIDRPLWNRFSNCLNYAW